jgi:hypothetical protein
VFPTTKSFKMHLTHVLRSNLRRKFSVHGSLTSEEAASLLKSITSSFRQQLNITHPARSTAPEKRRSRSPSRGHQSLRTQATPSNKAALDLVESILGHPLIHSSQEAVSTSRSEIRGRTRAASPSPSIQKPIVQDYDNIARCYDLFKSHIRTGTATLAVAIKCLDAIRDVKPTDTATGPWAELLTQWMRTLDEPVICLKSREFLKTAVPIFMARPDHARLLWSWFIAPPLDSKTGEVDISAVRWKRDLLSAMCLKRSCQGNFELRVSVFETFLQIAASSLWEGVPLQAKQTIYRSAARNLLDSYTWSSKRDPALLERLQTGYQTLGLDMLVLSAGLVHPTKPDINSARQFLETHVTESDVAKLSGFMNSDMRALFLNSALIAARTLTQQKDRVDDAVNWANLLMKHFPEQISMANLQGQTSEELSRWAVGTQAAVSGMRWLQKLDSPILSL